MYSPLPSLSGNLALDVACLILAGVAVAQIVRRFSDHLYDVQKKRTKLLSLRKTLELKSDEVAALRSILMHMREDIDQLRQDRLQEEAERAHLSQLAAHKEVDPKHAELEQDLHEAVRRPPHRFDA